MTDLAPFVASVLRDMVVDELQEEIRQLRVRLAASIGSSRTVSISGVNGEIYAEGHVDEDGRPREGADQRYGYFRHYDPETRQANLSFTIGGASIFATIGPLSQEDFDARPYEYDQAEIFDVFSDVFNKEGEAAVTLVFKTFQFANNLYTGWNVRPLVGNKES
jgi:hypothetical protein